MSSNTWVKRLRNGFVVEVEVIWKEEKRVPAASGQFFDSRGGVLFFEDNALWRFSGKNSKKEKIGGGGMRTSTMVGMTIPLAEAKFEGGSVWFGCEVEEGVFWCLSGSLNVIWQVDTRRDEVKVIIAGTGKDEAGTGGRYYESFLKKAVVNRLVGPLLSIIGPSGPQVYFYDRNKCRVAYPREKEIRTLDDAPDGIIFHPSLVRPSQTMLSVLPTSISPQGSSNSRLLTDPNISWAVKFRGAQLALSSVCVDLSTGKTFALSSSTLHPLLALSSSLMLAIEVNDNRAWVALVDWSLPPGLETVAEREIASKVLSDGRIKRISQLPGNFDGWWVSFRLDSATRQLHCYAGPGGLVSFSNVHITLKTQDGGTQLIFPSVMAIDLSKIDLSKLLLPECPLPSDVQWIQSASNASWNIHYYVLRHHKHLKTKENIDRLAMIIKNSSLPSSSISAFLRFLYFSSPVELTNAMDSFMPLCHCIQLCNQIGMPPTSTNYLLWLLERKIIPKLSNEALLQFSLTLWLVEQDPAPESIATYSKTSPLMSLLAFRCRKYASDAEIQDATSKFDFSKVAAPLPQIFGLCSSFGIFFCPGSSVSLHIPKLPSSPPSVSLQTLEWDETLSGASKSLQDKCAFLFTIKDSKKGGVICNARILYSRWSWFERLCKFENSVEARTRHVVMQSNFTPSALMAILSACYGIFIPHEQLSIVDKAVIHLRSGELELPEGPCFAKLIEKCRKSLSNSVTDANCLERLHDFWTAGFSMDSPLFADTLNTVLKNRDRITLGRLSKLPLRLRFLVSAYLDRSQAMPEELVASLKCPFLRKRSS